MAVVVFPNRPKAGRGDRAERQADRQLNSRSKAGPMGPSEDFAKPIQARCGEDFTAVEVSEPQAHAETPQIAADEIW